MSLQADYTFYTGMYHGTLSEEAFDRAAPEAEALVNALTLGRAAEVGEDLLVRVKLAECAAVDALDLAREQAGLVSETVGGRSATYQPRYLEERAAQLVRTYLSGTGLLYMGV